ncbi:hypothetical protein BASA81_006446 [Batrachochytrium salamandrivorans]|nr:hypothetical protein BASA81_006446 [Batrachochytrium salamandrivorans]
MRLAHRRQTSALAWAFVAMGLVLGCFSLLALRSSYAHNPPPLPSLSNVADVALPRYGTTIVTCFFDLAKMGQKTKHPASFYLQTGAKGTLGIASPMVIFTDSPEAVAKVRNKPHLSKIIPVSITDFDAYKLYFDQITNLFPRDWEGVTKKYSNWLFTVYHAKPELMARAARLDYFGTDKYLYMDVGAVRNWGGINASDYVDKQFPNPEREWLIGREDRVQMQSVAASHSTCEEHVRWVDAEAPELATSPTSKSPDVIKVRAVSLNWWIAGGLFSGNKRALEMYNDVYLRELGRYLAANLTTYSLIDQFMMGAIACTSDLVEVVRPPLPCCSKRGNRKWFFMLMYYKDATFPQTPYSDVELAAKGKPPNLT